MSKWDSLLTARDKQVFADSGWGSRMGFGQRPAVIVVDVNHNFVGDRPLPILDSIRQWRNSCGDEGWDAMAHIKRMLSMARLKRVPVFYSTGQDPRKDGFDAGRWAGKNSRSSGEYHNDSGFGNQIPDMIAVQDQDIVIPKLKPSAFFGTALSAYLVDLKVDTLLICGTTTSGCVRATVVDAFSLNYRVAVVDECTFDRGQASHIMSMYDMNEKYADVVSVAETIAYLEGVAEGMFDDTALFRASKKAV